MRGMEIVFEGRIESLEVEIVMVIEVMLIIIEVTVVNFEVIDVILVIGDNIGMPCEIIYEFAVGNRGGSRDTNSPLLI